MNVFVNEWMAKLYCKALWKVIKTRKVLYKNTDHLPNTLASFSSLFIGPVHQPCLIRLCTNYLTDWLETWWKDVMGSGKNLILVDPGMYFQILSHCVIEHFLTFWQISQGIIHWFHIKRTDIYEFVNLCSLIEFKGIVGPWQKYTLWVPFYFQLF